MQLYIFLCLKYGLPSPFSVLQNCPAASKESWNTLVKTRVTVWYEQELRSRSLGNSKMSYLNVQLLGLSGRPHPALQNILTTQDAKKLRLHLKFLTSDYLTNERIAKDRPSLSPACVLCSFPNDTIEHVMVGCKATADVRRRLFPELVNVVAQVQPMCNILWLPPPPSILTQFVLDCSSLNLPDSFRIPAHNPGIYKIYKISRDWSFGISCERSRLLRNMTK